MDSGTFHKENFKQNFLKKKRCDHNNIFHTSNFQNSRFHKLHVKSELPYGTVVEAVCLPYYWIDTFFFLFTFRLYDTIQHQRHCQYSLNIPRVHLSFRRPLSVGSWEKTVRVAIQSGTETARSNSKPVKALLRALFAS